MSFQLAPTRHGTAEMPGRLGVGTVVFQLCPLMRTRKPVRQFWPILRFEASCNHVGTSGNADFTDLAEPVARQIRMSDEIKQTTAA